ncbi:MAG: DUF481 domain-containing protein [Verrucomicrobiae bacterium]|nr:DUF481 domain-containing protein [Verrucomicrobiae bacterium]
MKKPIATIVLAAGIMAAFAETSTNTGAKGTVSQDKKYPWESRASAGLTLTQGNSDSLMVTAALVTQRKAPSNEYSFGMDGTYGKNNSVKNAETFHVFGQYNHLFNERIFDYIRGDYLHDGIAHLSYRVTLSPGVGYYLIKETNTTFAVEAGPGVTFRSLGGDHQMFATLRFAERFEHKFATGARVWESLEWLPEVDKWNNDTLNLEMGAEAALSKNLGLQIVLYDTYNTEPANGLRRDDLKLVSGITYKF